MYDEKTENNRNSIGVIKTWVARTGHSLLATKAHKNLLVVLARRGGGSQRRDDCTSDGYRERCTSNIYQMTPGV